MKTSKIVQKLFKKKSEKEEVQDDAYQRSVTEPPSSPKPAKVKKNRSRSQAFPPEPMWGERDDKRVIESLTSLLGEKGLEDFQHYFERYPKVSEAKKQKKSYESIPKKLAEFWQMQVLQIIPIIERLKWLDEVKRNEIEEGLNELLIYKVVKTLSINLSLEFIADPKNLGALARLSKNPTEPDLPVNEKDLEVDYYINLNH